MTRWRPAAWLLLIGGVLLVLVSLLLSYDTISRVQALQIQTQPLAPRVAQPVAGTNDESVSIAAPDQESPTAEDREIVAIGSQAKIPHQTSLEGIAGPEIGPGLTPGVVLENTRSVIRSYAARFGGNPFGNNREITAKLNGANSKQVVFLKEEDGMRLNQRGELIDNWGTPFFFHQISAHDMEIRSAGPDRKMWTEDDLVIK